MCIVIVRQRYICALYPATDSLRGLELVCCINFYGKCLNRVVVKNFVCDLITCMEKWLEDRLKFVFSPEIILFG